MNKFEYILASTRTGIAPLTLINNPLGWDKFALSYVYNKTYQSVLRNVTLPLEFIKEGYDYIKNEYEIGGIESEITVSIYLQNSVSLKYDQLFYTGIISYHDWSEDPKNKTFKTGFNDSDILSKFKGRDEITYNLDTIESENGEDITEFVSSPVEAKLPPIDLYRRAQIEYRGSVTEFIKSDITRTSYPNVITQIENDLGDKIPKAGVSNDVLYINNQDLNLSTNFKFDCLVTGEIYVGEYGGGATYNIDFVIYNASDIEQSRDNLFTQTETIAGFYDVLGSFSVDRTDDYYENWYLKIELITISTGTAVDNSMVYIITNKFSNEFPFEIVENLESEISETECKGYLIYEAFSRLIQLITDQTDTNKLITSEIFGRTDSEFQTYADDGDNSLLFVSNGHNIRRREKGIFCTFKDLWLSVSNMLDLSMYYNNDTEKFNIIKRSEYRKGQLLYDVENVWDFTIEIATDYYHNVILTGQKGKPDYEEFAGVDEINTPSEYSNFITKVSGKLNIQSVYRLDSVGIEKQRRQTVSEDSSLDNDNFIIQMKRDGVNYTPELGSDISAVSDDIINVANYYNIRFTPKTILVNNRHKIGTPVFRGKKDKKFKYKQNYNDVDVVTSLNRYGEKTDTFITHLYSPIELPEYYNFSAKITAELIYLLNTNSIGYIQFTYEDVIYKGYIEQCDIDIYSSEAKFKLIRANVV